MLASAFNQASSSASNNRIFVYEVVGLRQNAQTASRSYPVRNSSSLFIQVPYNRMNDEMRRITRLGGKIVGIHLPEDLPLATSAPAPEATASDGE